MVKYSNTKKWLYWGLAVFFYFYEYFLRVSPTVMVSQLMHDFDIQAAALGSLSTSYLYAYAFMQLPVGMLMDRFGARKLLAAASFTCAIGCFLFAISTHILFARIAWVLLGIGSAFAFIGMVYICSHWFRSRRMAFLVALGNAIGMLGAVGGEGPLSMAVQKYGWRLTMDFLGAVGLLYAIVTLVAVREDDTAEAQHEKLKRQAVDVWQNLKMVIKNAQSWLNGLGAFLLYMTTTTFAGLWGVPFLQRAYGLSPTAASFSVSMIFVGWIIGGPFVGKVSDLIKQRKIIIYICAFFAAICAYVAIYVPNLPLWVLYLVFILLGIFSSCENLCYCLAIELNPKEAKGCAAAFTNFVLFLGGAIIPLLTGLLLELNWDGEILNGVPRYTVGAYQFAFAIFPISFILAIIIYLFVKKSPIFSPEDERFFKT